jgi:curved DNA-binding protein
MGVPRDASQDDIKKAYRRLARKYHPDVSKESDAEERFKDLGEAYSVLRDAEKRAAYDGLGSSWQSGQEFRPPPGWDESFDFDARNFETGGPDAFSDFFESLFSGGMGTGFGDLRRQFDAHGEDQQAKVTIDIEDAYRGATKSITLRTQEMDSAGRVTPKERRLNVKIPKGVRQGQRIRLSGQGSPGIGEGKTGDLYLDVEFNPHPLYRVNGKDVYLDLPLTPWEAALGATIKIPTPDGHVDLRIPAGTTSGKRLRLRNRGLPGASPGDLYVVAKLTLPPANDDKAREIYRRMSDELPYNPRKQLEGQ